MRGKRSKGDIIQLGRACFIGGKIPAKPRYLISPAVYDDYVRVLKWVLPLVGFVVLAIGMILGAVDALKDGMTGLSYLNIFIKGISMGSPRRFKPLYG